MNYFTKSERRSIRTMTVAIIFGILFFSALPFHEKIWEVVTSWSTKDAIVHALPEKPVTTVSSQLPTAPTNIRLLGVSDEAIHVEWSGDNKATHYRYYLNGEEIGTTSWNGSVQSELQPGTVYEFGVRSVNVYGESAIATFSVKTNETSSLANPKHVQKKGDTLSWDAVEGATSYIVTSYGETVYEGPQTTTEHATTATGKTEYYFVQAINEDTASPGTLASFDSNGYFTPTVPYEWELSSKEDTLSIDWTKGIGATETVVYLNGKEVYTGKGNTLTLHEIEANEWYELSLHSINPIGESESINLHIQPNDFADKR